MCYTWDFKVIMTFIQWSRYMGFKDNNTQIYAVFFSKKKRLEVTKNISAYVRRILKPPEISAKLWSKLTPQYPWIAP